jgi:hypothetical protein
MPSKKLLPGVDFAPPESILSVLPRSYIEDKLTDAEVNKLLALVQKGRKPKARKGRKSDLNNDDDDAVLLPRRERIAPRQISKESVEFLKLKNEVGWALQFYVRDVAYRVEFPKVRSELNVLRNDIDRFLARLPQEHESVGFFLRRTYTGEVFLAKRRPTDEQLAQRKEAWSAKHGFDAIRNSLCELQRNIDCAASLLSGTRPPNMAVNRFVRSLAHAWKAATGCW